MVDRAALEMRSTCKRTGGSNPSLSATNKAIDVTAILLPNQSNYCRIFKGLRAGFERQVRQRPKRAIFSAFLGFMSRFEFSTVLESLTASQGRRTGKVSGGVKTIPRRRKRGSALSSYRECRLDVPFRRSGTPISRVA